MRVASFIKENNQLIPVEVELSLIPGLPQLHFIGLPDQGIRESTHRIKSALKHQGFEFPKAHQVLVNLRGYDFKKQSKGLDLAVATALLWETSQAPRVIADKDFFIYGELSLTGEVFEPNDLDDFLNKNHLTTILTGYPSGARDQNYKRLAIQSLRDLEAPKVIDPIENQLHLIRPMEGVYRSYPEEQAELLKILAVGGHSALLAGPSGSGKTTLAQSLISFCSEPEVEEFFESHRINRYCGFDINWRPLVRPHHSTPPLSMIGGGFPPVMGEISRAHGGILLLDELLEFNPQVQEALREPFEEGVIRISRRGRVREFPARVQIVATTNLCPCGDYVPNKNINCRLSRKRCYSYSEKLSGPLVDRFEVLYFTQSWRSSEKQISGKDIFEEIEKAIDFKINTRGQKTSNSKINIDLVREGLGQFEFDNLLPQLERSKRRQNAILRIARTIADLDLSEKIKIEHLQKALFWSFEPFEKLRRWE